MFRRPLRENGSHTAVFSSGRFSGDIVFDEFLIQDIGFGIARSDYAVSHVHTYRGLSNVGFHLGCSLGEKGDQKAPLKG
jgi:hypothetical protein